MNTRSKTKRQRAAAAENRGAAEKRQRLLQPSESENETSDRSEDRSRESDPESETEIEIVPVSVRVSHQDPEASTSSAASYILPDHQDLPGPSRSSRTSPRSVARTSPQQLDQTSPQQTPPPSAPSTPAAAQQAAQQAAQLEPYLERIARLEERVGILEQEINMIKTDHSAGGKWQFPRPTMHEYFRDVQNQTYRIVTGYGVNPETEERWLEHNPIYRVFISEYIYTMYPTAQVNFVGAVNKEKISHHARNVLYYRTALYMLRYLPNYRFYNWHNYTNKITTVLCNPPQRDPNEPLLTGNF